MTTNRLPDIFPPSVVAFMSDRRMDFILQEAGPVFSEEQSRYLRDLAGPFDQAVHLRQVHGNRILVVSDRAAVLPGPQEADGAVTHLAGVALSVRTADCLPVFLFDPRQRCIGLVHAGWRGSLREVVPEAVRAMERRYGSAAGDLKALLGPGIRPCCYEVGEEFRAMFPAATERRDGHWYLDLAGVNRNQLVGLGVREENIRTAEECTCCRETFFSYRREKEGAGRHLSFMMLCP